MKVTIIIESDDISSGRIEISESSGIVGGAAGDIGRAPDVLGRAVNRALRSATVVDRYGVDGYQDAAWTVIRSLDVDAKPA